MEKKKRQRIKDGAVVNINLSENRIIFARLLVDRIAVYDFVMPSPDPIPAIETIISKPVLFYCSIYDQVITKGEFDIIGFKELTTEEIDNVPPGFMQNLVDINDCHIFYHDGREYEATPHECIGLERASVWGAAGLIKRIEDHYAGRKNIDVESAKPILSEDDPRYLPKPLTLRWDFEKQLFYRTDKPLKQ